MYLEDKLESLEKADQCQCDQPRQLRSRCFFSILFSEDLQPGKGDAGDQCTGLLFYQPEPEGCAKDQAIGTSNFLDVELQTSMRDTPGAEGESQLQDLPETEVHGGAAGAAPDSNLSILEQPAGTPEE